MKWEEFLTPNWKKTFLSVTWLIAITYAFFKMGETYRVQLLSVIADFQLSFLYSASLESLIVSSFIIDVVYSYLVACLIIRMYNKFRK